MQRKMEDLINEIWRFNLERKSEYQDSKTERSGKRNE